MFVYKTVQNVCAESAQIEISSQRRENLLFTNMAAMTSHENDLFIELLFDAYIKLLLYQTVLAVSD